MPDHILGGKIWRKRKIRNISIADIYVGDADGGTPKTKSVAMPTQICVPTSHVGTSGAVSGRRKSDFPADILYRSDENTRFKRKMLLGYT